MKRSLSLAILPFLLPTVGFGLTLEEAVKHVTFTNPVITERVKNYEATTHDITKAKADLLPKIDVGIYYAYETTRNITYPTSVKLNRRGHTFDYRQNIFDGFGTLQNIDQQKARTEAAKEDVIFTANALSLQTTEAYLELMKQYEFLKIAQKNLENHKKIMGRINERTDSGFGSRSEQDQAKARLALAESNLVIQQSNFEDARTTFERIYGESIDVKTLIRPNFNYMIPVTLDNAIQKAQEKHPAVAVQDSNIEVAKKRLGVAKKAFLPKLDLQVAIDDSWNANGNPGEDYGSYAKLTLSYNIFNGTFDMANKEQQEVKILQEGAIKDNLMRRISENLGFAWTAYTELGKQLPFLEQHRDYSVTTLEAYNQEFSLGRRTLIDLLNAENELTGAEKEVVKAQYDLLLSKYRILEGMGELASDLNAAPVL